MIIEVPEPGLVLLLGPSGSGKTGFAGRHFRTSEVLSSDLFRELVGGDKDPKSASGDGFLALRFVAAKRMRRAALTVIDATNLNPRSRSSFMGLAVRHGLSAVAIAFCLPQETLLDRDKEHRRLGETVIRTQADQLRAGLSGLSKEGIARVYVLESEAAVEACVVRRVPAEQPEFGGRRPVDAEQIELL